MSRRHKKKRRKRRTHVPKKCIVNNNTLTIHHRKPMSIGGSNDRSNISLISYIKHDAWHRLFDNMGVNEIVNLINSKYLDPDWVLIAVRKEVIHV